MVSCFSFIGKFVQLFEVLFVVCVLNGFVASE